MDSRREFLTHAAAIGLSVTRVPKWATTTMILPRSAPHTVLRGATVYDGTGGPGIEADVAIDGDRISGIGARLDAPGAEEVQLNGLSLAPGFIDIHSHTDLELLVDPHAQSKVRQGVTTEIAGQDGSSVGPWRPDQQAQMADQYERRYGVDIDFSDLRGFFHRIRRAPGSVNLASMVGAGTLRDYVIGLEDRPATSAELDAMRRAVRDALDAGACGLSSGLEYVPGAFAGLDELVALAGELRGSTFPYASHMRNEDDQLLGSIEEALNVGRLADVPVQISHLKAQGLRNWWKADLALDTLTRARADGIDVHYDRYPYIAYSTGLSSLFPVWSRSGGTEAFLARLEDLEFAPRIEQEVRAKVAKLGSWDAVQITSTGRADLAWARGRRVGQLASERGEDPYALTAWLIREDRSSSGMVGFGMSEENTASLLAHPLGMVCSDGSALATSGPLSDGTPHPRSYGTFARVLGHYCRDESLMPLGTAVHKMTQMPAEKVRLQDRGVIRVGAFADLVAFDSSTVADRATFDAPHQYPTGIPHVIVNGAFVIRDGAHTGERVGRVLGSGV